MIRFVGYFSAAVAVIVVAVALSAADKRAFGRQFVADRMNFVVYAPKVYVVLGLVCTGLFAFCLAMSIVSMDRDTVFYSINAIFGAFCALGVYLLFRSLRWRLMVRETELTLTPAFGRRRSIPVGEVTRIETNLYDIRVYMGEKKLFSLDRRHPGSFALVSYLIEMGVRAPEKIDWGRVN